jgi:predicted XRE-type DNA-binding protein
MKRTTEQAPIVTPSSGNVFADLGLPDPAARLLKASLVVAIREAIRVKGLNQTQAAEFLGISQPRISSILKGELDGFAIDIEQLCQILDTLGQEVVMVVKPKSG